MSTKKSEGTKGGNALVVEGGAMRGIFSTGVLDAFLEKNFNPFDVCIGVSAGATNLAAYLAGMYKRNYRVYTDYSLRPEFISWKKFIKGGHLLDLDWLWDITIKDMKLNEENIVNSGKEFCVGVTDVNTGKAVYLNPDGNNLEDVVKASSSIPVLYRNFVELGGKAFVDGGLADPIPVKEAYRRKAKNIMVLRSRPYSFHMKQGSGMFTSRFYLRKYPSLLEAVRRRPEVYKDSIDFMRNSPEDVRIFEVNPPEEFKTQRLTKDISILEQDYKLGYETGLKMIDKWNSEVV